MKTFTLNYGEKYGLIAISDILVDDNLTDGQHISSNFWIKLRPPIRVTLQRFFSKVAEDIINYPFGSNLRKRAVFSEPPNCMRVFQVPF